MYVSDVNHHYTDFHTANTLLLLQTGATVSVLYQYLIVLTTVASVGAGLQGIPNMNRTKFKKIGHGNKIGTTF